MRLYLSGILAILLTFNALAMYACSRQSFISNARTAHRSYLEAEPLFRALGVSTKNLNVAIQVSNDLVTAFEQNQDAAALDLVAALIHRTNEIIAEDVSIIRDESRRVKVISTLALANIALHWIADNIIKEVEAAATSEAVTDAASADSASGRSVTKRGALRGETGALNIVREFANQEPWGKAYAH